MIDPKIVRNYAACLFDNIKSDEDHKLVLEQVSMLNEVLRGSSLVHFAFCAPVVSRHEKLKVIEALGKKFHFDKIVSQFFGVLAKNARFNILPEIVTEYKKLFDQTRGIKSVALEAANKPSGKELEIIKKYLEDKLQKIVEFKVSTNKSLIGGVVIKYDSMLCDYSISGAIDRVTKLAKNASV